MFRDKEDHGMFLNLLALRCFSDDTDLSADAEMSNHIHLNVFSSIPSFFAGHIRMSYTKYFNHKYGRKGRFGEKSTFIQKVEGYHHQMVVQNYIHRNGLHHGASPTAFGYKYCSVRELFTKDIGLEVEKPVGMSRQQIASFLPRHSEFPDRYQMNADGVFVRSSFMEIRRAEQFYVTPRNYLYQMNRLTDENWIKEQAKDETGSPFTIADIERADEQSVSRMLMNESGRGFNRNRMQDLDVCALIDKELALPCGVSSVYQLTDSQKMRIAKQLYYDYHIKLSQINRCLLFDLTALGSKTVF